MSTGREVLDRSLAVEAFLASCPDFAEIVPNGYTRQQVRWICSHGLFASGSALRHHVRASIDVAIVGPIFPSDHSPTPVRTKSLPSRRSQAPCMPWWAVEHPLCPQFAGQLLRKLIYKDTPPWAAIPDAAEALREAGLRRMPEAASPTSDLLVSSAAHQLSVAHLGWQRGSLRIVSIAVRRVPTFLSIATELVSGTSVSARSHRPLGRACSDRGWGRPRLSTRAYATSSIGMQCERTLPGYWLHGAPAIGGPRDWHFVFPYADLRVCVCVCE